MRVLDVAVAGFRQCASCVIRSLDGRVSVLLVYYVIRMLGNRVFCHWVIVVSVIVQFGNVGVYVIRSFGHSVSSVFGCHYDRFLMFEDSMIRFGYHVIMPLGP